MAITNLTIIRRSMTARLFSTVTTIITVAVAVALTLVLVSMRDSAEKAFERGAGNMHLLLSKERDRLVSVLHAVYYSGLPEQYIEWREFREIVQKYGDPTAGPAALEFLIPIQQGDSYRGFPVTATTPEFFTHFSPDQRYSQAAPPDRREGEPWRLQDPDHHFLEGPFDAVVGAEVAKRTGLRVGDVIHMTHGASDSPGAHVHDEFDWTVTGILAPTGSAHDRAIFIHIESSWIVHAHDRRVRDTDGTISTTAADLLDEDRKITGILLRVTSRPGRQLSPMTGPIAFDLNTRFTVAEPRTEVKNLFEIVGNVNLILLAMAIVVMVSSAISIMLALYNSMEQRRRQIAVLRVLGCTRLRVFGLVLSESALLGAAGSAAGLLLCLIAARVVAGELRRQLGIVVEPSLPVWTTLGIVAGAVVLAMAAGIVPASVAYRTSVARNLRPIG